MNKKYKPKARDSFTTKFKIYLYKKGRDKALNNVSLADFNNFELDQDISDEYATVYWQNEEDYQIPGKSISIKEIETSISDWESKNKAIKEQFKKEYVDNFEAIFSHNKFEQMLEAEQWFYCDTNLKEFAQLRQNKQLYKKQLTRGWDSLEIDRKSPNLEYTADNTVMCCYWCNNAKTDEYSADEFKIIANGIRKVWQERLIKLNK